MITPLLFDAAAPSITTVAQGSGAKSMRDYQLEALDGIEAAFRQHHSALVVMPTGTGKTVVMSEYIRRYLERNPTRRVLVIVHRDALIWQAQRQISGHLGERVDIEMAEHYAATGGVLARVVATTVQTQAHRRQRMDPSGFGLVICDEAHHAVADTWIETIAHYVNTHDTYLLGFTATPDRLDEEALGKVFAIPAYELRLIDAIQRGYLVRPVVRTIHIEGVDYSQVRAARTESGLNEKQVAEIVQRDEVVYATADVVYRETAQMKTLVFAASVLQAKNLAAALNAHEDGIARHVIAETTRDERQRLYADYRAGTFRILVNVGVATEGYDEPSIECIVLARPTTSRALYAQMIGRGLRPLDGLIDCCDSHAERLTAIETSTKPCCHIIDLVGNSGKHKLATVLDLLGDDKPEDIQQLAREIAARRAAQGQEADALDVLAEAEHEQHERERIRRRDESRARVIARAKYLAGRSTDPFDVLDIECRERAYEKGRQPTDRMIAALQNAGVDNARALTFAEARALLEEIAARRSRGLATYKQARLLRKYRIDAREMRFERAGEIIAALRRNGWRMTRSMRRGLKL